MKKRYKFAACLLALLLSGCALGELHSYPYEPESRTYSPAKITLAVSQEEWMVALGGQISEKIAALTDDTVTLEVAPQEDPLAAYRANQADLVFCDTSEMRQADSSLGWLSLPFLFDGPQVYLAALNSPQSPIRNLTALKQAFAGEVVGVYYDCGWMMALDAAEMPSALTNLKIGADERMAGLSPYTELGAQKTLVAPAGELPQMLAKHELDLAEFRADDLSAVEGATAVNLSRHRMEGRFLILREGVCSENLRLCIKQAVSATVEQACAQRMNAEESSIAGLASGMIPVTPQSDTVSQSAQKWYLSSEKSPLTAKMRSYLTKYISSGK